MSVIMLLSIRKIIVHYCQMRTYMSQLRWNITHNTPWLEDSDDIITLGFCFAFIRILLFLSVIHLIDWLVITYCPESSLLG